VHQDDYQPNLSPPPSFEEIPLDAYSEGPPPMDLPPLDAYGGGGSAPMEAEPSAVFEQRRPVVSSENPLGVLKEVFGYDTFRPLQGDIISSVLQLKDTLAIMPTGGGKSLCYQLPALLFDGLTVVVSPLISLMQDQVRQLEALGVEAAVLNSSLSRSEYRAQQMAVSSGRAKLLYLAPETLFQDRTLGLLKRTQVSCLTIDEAHCISEWGHDFRPEYRRLVEIRQHFPKAVCIGLTATATPRVRDDIAKALGFSDDARFVASFDRPNLRLRVSEKEKAFDQLRSFIDSANGPSGIVYCSTRKGVEELATKLVQNGYKALPYHAGLGEQIRRSNQERFIRDDVDIIVATVAFGMGINKPDVRFVAHYNMPKSVESYYQEIGRAGRDGERAHCLLLFGGQDLRTIDFLISQKSDSEQRIARLQLSRMMALAEATVCRRRPLMEYFGETYETTSDDGCGACDNCLEPQPDLVDITVDAQKFLSCVYRTGQRFGAGHIVDVLRGSKAQKILRAGHDRVSTYGIGHDRDPKQWRHISRQLIQHGLLVQDPTYGSLVLGPNAAAVLRGQQTVEGRIAKPAKKGSGASRRDLGEPTDYPSDLFNRLRVLRKRLADDAKMPPYTVFPDKTLMQLSSEQPQSTSAMNELHGVGRVKLAKFGVIFLEEIRQWRIENDKPVSDGNFEVVEAPQKETRSADSAGAQRQNRFVAGLLLGKTIDELAKAEGIKVDTACSHIERFMSEGGTVSVQPGQLTRLSDNAQEEIIAALKEFGDERLKPLFEATGGQYDYTELRRIRLLWRVKAAG
jgi:ATP-dependent DNA helicase RecQ